MFGLRNKNKRKFFYSCLNTDKYDKISFERLLDISPKLQDIESQGEALFPGYINLMGDQWSALYKTAPEINPEAGERAMAHKPLIQKIMGSEEYKKLREQTVLDDFSAAIGTLSLSEITLDYIRKKKEEDEQFKELLEQQKQIQKQFNQVHRSIEKNELQGKVPTKSQEQKKQSLDEQLQQVQQQISQQLADSMDVGQMLSQAAQEAQEARESIEDLVSGSQPGSGHAEMQKIPLRHQLELASQLKKYPKIKQVAEWAGRFKRIARKKQKSKNVFSVERQGITRGDNPELLLPGELAQLKNPATRLDFYRRFAEKQTLQYSPLGKEQAGKGPIVLCLDQSGSMGARKEQAAGFALAIAMIAKAQKRDFAYIPFDTEVGGIMTFQKGKISTDAIIRIAMEFLGGGTNFEAPLRAAVQTIEQSSRFKNADIIFVTDGEDEISTRFLHEYRKKKTALKFQCIGCVIGNGSHYIKDNLAKVVDELFYAQDFIEAAEKSSIFEI